MRVSRWIRSEYETDAALQAERVALSGLVQMVEPGADAEIIVVSSKERVDARRLAGARSVRLVVTTTSGTDHLDLDWMRSQGVAACRLPEARRDAVAEATLALMMAGLRGSAQLQAWARAGDWGRARLPDLAPRTIQGARVGLVGLGVIGRKVAELLIAMGARVHGVDPRGLPEGVRASTVEQMLAECDALSLHCDLNPTSAGLLSDRRLALAHDRLVIVNTARGGLLDVDAAIDRLRAGQLAGLGIDVFPDEPYAHMDRVLGLPGLWLTPHAAGYHDRLAERVSEGLRRVVQAFVRGEALPYRCA